MQHHHDWRKHEIRLNAGEDALSGVVDAGILPMKSDDGQMIL
jgi:hypothetical protein